MIIAKELEWVREYIKTVGHLLPHLKQLKRISSRKANKDKIMRCHGSCTKYYDTVHYRITLYVNYSSVDSYNPLTVVIRPYSKIDTLRFLAHELSHLEHWEHTPDRMYLECSILSIFMTKLKAEGYISEEDESTKVKGIQIT